MFPMKGSLHGPGGNLGLEYLEVVHLVTILNSRKRKRKDAIKVKLEKLLGRSMIVELREEECLDEAI